MDIIHWIGDNGSTGYELLDAVHWIGATRRHWQEMVVPARHMDQASFFLDGTEIINLKERDVLIGTFDTQNILLC